MHLLVFNAVFVPKQRVEHRRELISEFVLDFAQRFFIELTRLGADFDLAGSGYSHDFDFGFVVDAS